MPYISKEQRAQGGWSPREGRTPNTRHAGPCGHYDGGDLCGALSERRYLIGHRCEDHTPAKVGGRPEPTTPDPLPSTAPRSDPSRYGRATTDPLGRDGPGWHKGSNGLPVKSKGDKGDQCST